MSLAALWAAIQRWYAGHSARDQRIIQAVSAGTVLSLVYVLVVEPLRAYRRQTEEAIASGHEQLENDMRFLAAADALRAERLELSKRLAQAKKQLLPGDSGTLGAAALQERTSALAAERMRIEVAVSNLANAESTRSSCSRMMRCSASACSG